MNTRKLSSLGQRFMLASTVGLNFILIGSCLFFACLFLFFNPLSSLDNLLVTFAGLIYGVITCILCSEAHLLQKFLKYFKEVNMFVSIHGSILSLFGYLLVLVANSTYETIENESGYENLHFYFALMLLFVSVTCHYGACNEDKTVMKIGLIFTGLAIAAAVSLAASNEIYSAEVDLDEKNEFTQSRLHFISVIYLVIAFHLTLNLFSLGNLLKMVRHNDAPVFEHDFDWFSGVLMLIITATLLSQGIEDGN